MTEASTQTASDLLLDAAEELFASRGYADVGIREIADRAGVNLALIKYHFGSKKHLYLATVHRAMTRGEGSSAWELIEPEPASTHEAACSLARFMDAFLSHLLREESSACSCGRLLIREGLEPTEAIDGVIDDYIRPNHMTLRNLLRQIQPEMEEAALARCVSSVLGQILHYLIFRSFVERTADVNMNDPDAVRAISRHVTSFSLRGMGCEPVFIDAVMDTVFSGEATGAINS